MYTSGPPSAGPEALYLATYSSSSSAAAKRKAQRASQACENCRQLKAKCDETKPCKNCREKKTECKYRDPIPKQSDKVQVEVLDGINSLKETLEMMARSFEARFERLEASLKFDPRPDPIKKEPVEMDESTSRSLVTGAMDPDIPIPSVQEDEPPDETMAEAPPADEPEAEKDGDSDSEEQPPRSPRSPVPPGKPAIPSKHTTGAGLLLKWPAVAHMMGDLLEKEEGINMKHLHEFPLKNEEERGLLHIYGCGEGRGEGRRKANKDASLHSRDSIMDIGSIPTGPDSPDTGPSPSPSNDWGHIGGFIGDTPQAVTSVDGKPTRGTTGELDLEPATVRKLVQSYEDNIQNMHPIILKNDLHAIVNKFLLGLGSAVLTKPATKTSGVAMFANTGIPVDEIGQKRKRGGSSDGGPEPGSPPLKVQRMSRHIQTAVVLCVLALGKICLHKEALPDVVPGSEPIGSGSSSIGRNGTPPSPPAHGSPPSMTVQSILSPMADPVRAGPTSRRSSFEGQSPFKTQAKRNMDVIPGLDYLALATDIIGNQVGGSTLWHIYANLLAGLYYGQLGRVLESYSHILAASMKVQQLMRGDFARLIDGHTKGVPQNSASDTRFFFLFWSCMQLESDIIAELHLPQSGILTYEENFPLPPLSGAMANGIDERVAKSYLGQLYLRKQLNKAHTLLYGDRLERSHYRGMLDMIQQLSDMIDPNLWVAPVFKFDPENDPPATEILDARLRAKFWGATNIICRPIIKSILNSKFKEQRSDGPEEIDYTDPINEVVDPNDPVILSFAKKGIRALIESTKAFHGLKERRFIITNVFGTAHAQWGNMITLAAVYQDEHLRPFINPLELSILFQRTIDFLQTVAHRTSALTIGLNLLIGLRDKLDLPPPVMQPAVNTSFSGTTSSHQPPTPGPSTPLQESPVSFGGHISHKHSGQPNQQQGPQQQQKHQQHGPQQPHPFASPKNPSQDSPKA